MVDIDLDDVRLDGLYTTRCIRCGEEIEVKLADALQGKSLRCADRTECYNNLFGVVPPAPDSNGNWWRVLLRRLLSGKESDV